MIVGYEDEVTDCCYVGAVSYSAMALIHTALLELLFSHLTKVSSAHGEY